MASAEQGPRLAETPRPIFADVSTIERLLGVPEHTVRQLARELVVAAHKLGDAKQGKCVYLFADVEDWVRARPAPEWVGRHGRDPKATEGT